MEYIPVTRIKDGGKYSFSFPLKSGVLTDSIKRAGIIQPLILTPSHNIICGMRRFVSAKELGIKDVPCIILRKKLKDIDIFKINIEENLSVRALNIIEKSLLLNKLKNDFSVPEEIIIKEFMPRAHIPADKKYLSIYMRTAALPNGLKQKIVENRLRPDALNEVKEWQDDIIYTVLHTLMDFGFGNNKILKILRLLNEISLTTGLPVNAPLKSTEWQNICSRPDIPPFQKGIYLKEMLKEKRYPVYTKYKDRIKRLLGKMPLSRNISLPPDRLLGLEEDTITFEVVCAHPEELKTAGKKLAEISETKELKEILEILRP